MANNHKEFKIRVVFVDPSEIPDEDRSRMEEAKKELDKAFLQFLKKQEKELQYGRVYWIYVLLGVRICAAGNLDDPYLDCRKNPESQKMNSSKKKPRGRLPGATHTHKKVESERFFMPTQTI